MDLFSAPQTQAMRINPLNAMSRSSLPHWDERPAWAQPQTAWPFRVIDPQSHRIAGVEHVSSRLGFVKFVMQEAQVRHLVASPMARLAEYDFLRATYEALLRNPQTGPAALDAAFDSLDAAHERLRSAHRHHCGEAAVH